MSQQLAQLEQEAGVPLLERVGRNVRLTVAAQTLVAHADACSRASRRPKRTCRRPPSWSPARVRVAAIQSAGLYLLAPALRRLASAHPALRVEVTDAEPETSMPALALGASTGARRRVPVPAVPPDPRLDLEPLLEEHFRVCCRPSTRWRDRRPVALAELRDEPWAIGKADSHYGELTIRACRTFGGFEPDVRHRSNDLLMLLALVSNGQAVTLLPDLVRAIASRRGRPRRRGGTIHAHGLRRDPPRQRAAAGAQCAASGTT